MFSLESERKIVEEFTAMSKAQQKRAVMLQSSSDSPLFFTDRAHLIHALNSWGYPVPVIAKTGISPFWAVFGCPDARETIYLWAREKDGENEVFVRCEIDHKK